MQAAKTKSNRKPKGSGHLRRSEILEVAQKIFAEEGYEGATVRKIAEQVGVSSTAIYLHFPDKRAMLMEIATAALAPLLADSVVIAKAAGVDPKEKARRMMQAYMRFAVENPSAYDVVFSDAPRQLAGAEDPAWEVFASYHRHFLAVITELANLGRLKVSNPHLGVQTLWSGCHGVIALRRANPHIRWSDYEEMRDAMIDGLLRGLVAD